MMSSRSHLATVFWMWADSSKAILTNCDATHLSDEAPSRSEDGFTRAFEGESCVPFYVFIYLEYMSLIRTMPRHAMPCP
jgi:hypothetical protein